ncbi:hypothetical protein B0O99DRAFT_501918 [Bisporella sp. PMI_857]|nr:hypothetical protein B0O99DRAFT_501918 [Bisporella sp. PMI_857]
MAGPVDPKGSNITEQVGKDPSSKTESNASSHPIHDQGEPRGDKVEFRHFQANPGPAITQVDVPQEGTKEERRAKAQELNK